MLTVEEALSRLTVWTGNPRSAASASDELHALPWHSAAPAHPYSLLPRSFIGCRGLLGWCSRRSEQHEPAAGPIISELLRTTSLCPHSHTSLDGTFAASSASSSPVGKQSSGKRESVLPLKVAVVSVRSQHVVSAFSILCIWTGTSAFCMLCMQCC
jgi:hypothetical protein